MDRRRHLRFRKLGGNDNNGKNDINGKNENIGTDGRNGTNEYRFPEPPSHFANFFASQFFFFLQISRTDISECRARVAQDELSIRVCVFSKVISSSHVSSQLARCP